MSDWRPILEPHCPEIQELQKGWQVLVTIEEPRRCYFLDPAKRTTSFDHPKRGPLPKPWILRVYGTSSIGYYNRDTQAFITEDPRSEKPLEAESGKCQPGPLEGDLKTIGLSLVKAPPHLKMAAHVTKWPSKGHDLDKLQRQPIGKDKSLRDAYQIVHTLDPGANAEGGIGGMNDGVHIVKMIGVPDRLFVEKRFIGAKGMIKYAKKEIEMLRRCKHLALSCYVAGFISEGHPAEGSVYVEFCDRGSLSDVIKSYRKNKVKIPEGFLWHAFLGLCDGLTYMHGGGRFMTAHPNPPDPKWKPLVHRDMKPDNVLLRGRTTHGSNKPPYCVLSDFGLTCEEGPDNANRMKCGTSLYYAPELLYTPFPTGDIDSGPEWFKFKVPQSHSADIWALGIIIYCMSKPSEFAHINLEIKDKIAKDMPHHKYYEGTASRIPWPYKLDQAYYTKELEEAINLATVVDAEKRLDGNRIIRELKALFDGAVKSKGNMVLECRLEEFAAPKHKYRADECEVRTGLKKGGWVLGKVVG